MTAWKHNNKFSEFKTCIMKDVVRVGAADKSSKLGIVSAIIANGSALFRGVCPGDRFQLTQLFTKSVIGAHSIPQCFHGGPRTYINYSIGETSRRALFKCDINCSCRSTRARKAGGRV